MFKVIKMCTRVNKTTEEKRGEHMEQELGKKIRDRRKKIKMSQETLAKKSNISRARISAIENGKCRNLLVSTLTAIASALDTTVEFFLT